MNANSGMAGPTAAFTSFQSCWLKWLRDTVCAAAHSHSQSFYFIPYLSPASFFFFYCHLQCLCLSLSSFPFCVISNPQNSTCHCIIFQYGVFIFNRASCHYDFFVWVHMRLFVFSLAFVCRNGERDVEGPLRIVCVYGLERERKNVCV